MAGILKRYAKTGPIEGWETIQVSVPKDLKEQFTAYLEKLGLSMEEAVAHLMEEELKVEHPSNKGERYKLFWMELLDAMGVKRVALPQSWYAFAIGIKGLAVGVSFTRDGHLRVDLYIDTGDKGRNHQILETLQRDRAAIESALGGVELSWESLPTSRACRIAIYREGRIDGDATEELLAWAQEWVEKFQAVFGPRVRSL